MKKSLRVIIQTISYIFSALMTVGLFSIAERFFSFEEKSIGILLYYLAALVLAVPFSIFLTAPSIKALYFRQVRKNRSAAGMSKAIRSLGKSMPASGAALFMVKDDEAMTVTNASSGFWNIIGVHSRRTISLASLIHPDDAKDVRLAFLSNDVIVPKVDARIIRPNGGVAQVRICGVKEELGRSGIVVSNCVAVDITDFHAQNLKLTQDIDRYRALLGNLGSAVWEYSIERDEIYLLNRHRTDGNFEQVKDYRSAFISSGVVHPDHIKTYLELCDQLRRKPKSVSAELRLKNYSGNYCWYSIIGQPVTDQDGAIFSYIGQIKKINDLTETEVTPIPDNYDTLTHLYNRYSFETLVNSSLRTMNRSSHGALFILNVDNFQHINNSLGRLFGDALLIELSGALKNLFDDDAIISRISGDEFGVYLKEYTTEERVFELAGAVCGCVRHCFLNKEKSENVTCSVGVALSPAHGSSFEQLFFRADSALVYAKHRGAGNYYIYNPEIDSLLDSLTSTHTHEIESSPAISPLSFRDDSLLAQVVDILFQSRELGSSINLILSLLGRRFNLDHVYVIELSDGTDHGTITYSWHSEQLERIDTEPFENARQHIHCATRDEYFLSNDMRSYVSTRPELARLNELYHVEAMLQCPIVDGNDLIGCFSYALCQSGRSFTESEASQILMITKIITGYLVRLRSKQDIDRITYRDKLTGIMNFTAFQMEFERLLSSTTDRNYAIVYSDIDRFKFINEKYGFRAGDDILRTVADIHRKQLGKDELFARVTADKFIALIKYSSVMELDQRINALHDSINHIKKTESTCYYLPVRSGVYLIQPGDTSISGMIDLANLARKSVKNIHISTISHFNETMKSRLKRQQDIEQVMADALVQEEFLVYYQPKFSLSNNSLAGAEALVRWKRPNMNTLMRPDEFIPIFEDNGFVIELDFYVLERVCRKLRRDIDSHKPVLPISVNFSRTHLNSDGLIPRLNECLKKYDIPPNLIEIEITESALTENEGYLIDIISQLHNIGLVVSMDDFGSGFSSLNLLKKLPVDVLKIDKNFFATDSATERERCIIENVVNMARSLGIHVVSEGVETTEQANFLRSIKCDLAQGYLFGAPTDERTYETRYQFTED